MKILFAPRRLRFAAIALLLGVPIAVLETVIISRAPWWNLPIREMWTWCLAVLFISLPLVIWILQAKRWAFWLASLFFGLWILLSAWVSIRMKFPALGFFTAGLTVVFGMLLKMAYREISRSFLDPQLRWYFGLPKAIPNLKCQISLGESKMEVNASRIDPDGVFIFSPKPISKEREDLLPPLLENEFLSLDLQFRGRSVQLLGKPVSTLERGLGVGIQFLGLSMDHKKELGDFIEALRGEGYVQ